MDPWPETAERLVDVQAALAEAGPAPWEPGPGTTVGGCFVCFERGGEGPGSAGDRGWAAAVVTGGGPRLPSTVDGVAGGPYRSGLLALREGPLLERAVRSLATTPAVLLVNATGRDHPRRAGLALHLGSVLGIPTVGVTHRPLLASGPWPAGVEGATEPLILDGRVVGYWLRTRAGARPVAVHAAWATGPETAVEVVLAATRRARTPEPIRQARRLARLARSQADPRRGRRAPRSGPGTARMARRGQARRAEEA